jgi:hypothetical protein
LVLCCVAAGWWSAYDGEKVAGYKQSTNRPANPPTLLEDIDVMDRLTHLQSHRPKLLAGLILFAGAALLPYGWLANVWPLFGFLVDALFRAEWVHIISHFALFAVLGTAVLILFPHLVQRPRVYFALILTLGLLQEALQLLTFKHRFFAASDLFDLLTDVAGAGVALLWFMRQMEKRHANR